MPARAPKRGCSIRTDPVLLALWQRHSRRGDGGANNPHGLGGRSGKTAEELVTVDNIHSDKDGQRPTGTSAAAGMRRLQTAAETDPQARAEYDAVLSGEKKVHVDFGRFFGVQASRGGI